MPKVSVIIPVYNEGKFLKACLTSIANQTLQDIEIIIINDGSTDNSMDVINKFANQYNGVLKVINTENNGVGAARNRGLDIADGEFIKFVDADDFLKLDILEKMYLIAKENNVSLVRGNYQTIIGPIKTIDTCSWSGIKGNQIIDVRQNKDYIITETPGIGNKLISRALIDNLRFPEKTKWEDLAIMPVVIASSEKVFSIDAPVYNYRVNMNTTITDFIKKIPNILDIIKCLDMLETTMKQKGLSDYYSEQIESLYILHTLFRIENVMMWFNFSHSQKEVVIQSLISILDLKYPGWKDDEILNKYKRINPLFGIDMTRVFLYTKNYQIVDDKEELIKRIKRSFE